MLLNGGVDVPSLVLTPNTGSGANGGQGLLVPLVLLGSTAQVAIQQQGSLTVADPVLAGGAPQLTALGFGSSGGSLRFASPSLQALEAPGATVELRAAGSIELGANGAQLDLAAASLSAKAEGDLTIAASLATSGSLDLLAGGTLTVTPEGRLEADGDLSLKAAQLVVNGDGGTAGPTLVHKPTSVATGTRLADQRLPFSGDVRLVVDSARERFTLVGADGVPLPHGLSSGATLYYQSRAGNQVPGRAGLINTNTTTPDEATPYTVRVLSASSFQLVAGGAVVNLSGAEGPAEDALVGLQVSSVTTPITTTTTSLVGAAPVTVGQQWFSYDLTLLHDGYYTPASGLIRDYLLPGKDFSLASVDWSRTTQPDPGLAWEDYSPGQVEAVPTGRGTLPPYATSPPNTQQVP